MKKTLTVYTQDNQWHPDQPKRLELKYKGKVLWKHRWFKKDLLNDPAKVQKLEKVIKCFCKAYGFTHIKQIHN